MLLLITILYFADSLTRSCFGIHVLLKSKPIQSTPSFFDFLNFDGFDFHFHCNLLVHRFKRKTCLIIYQKAHIFNNLFPSGTLVLHAKGKHSPWNIRTAFTGSMEVGQHASISREIKPYLSLNPKTAK